MSRVPITFTSIEFYDFFYNFDKMNIVLTCAKSEPYSSSSNLSLPYRQCYPYFLDDSSLSLAEAVSCR